MGKGKLKEALENTDMAESAKEKTQKPSVPKAGLQGIEPELGDEDSALAQEVEELQSKETLSKKEKRRLKKLLEKMEERKQAQKDENADEDESDEEDEGHTIDFKKLAESESESEDEEEEKEEADQAELLEAGDAENKDEEAEGQILEEDEEDVPFSEAELDSDGDVVPHNKLNINNVSALKESLARIQLPWAQHSFIEYQSIISSENASAGIKDIYDDTERELAFYKQALDAAKQGKAALLKLKVPFTRPLDYFAEMVKSDEHMDRLKKKLLKEAADLKASEEAKKQRQLKKFGKKVMHETLQERDKQKKETLEKIKSLKKKRGANEMLDDDDFQIALDEATGETNKSKRVKPNAKRLAKDSKYGFGGKKRFFRKNDAESSSDIYDQRKKKGKAARPGKSKRSRL